MSVFSDVKKCDSGKKIAMVSSEMELSLIFDKMISIGKQIDYIRRGSVMSARQFISLVFLIIIFASSQFNHLLANQPLTISILAVSILILSVSGYLLNAFRQ